MGAGSGSFVRASRGACIWMVCGRGSKMRRSIRATGPVYRGSSSGL